MDALLADRLAAVLPTPTGTLLLRAALLGEADDWHAWVRAVGDPERAIRTNTDGARRLAPLLARGAGRLDGFGPAAALTALRVSDRLAEGRTRVFRELAGSALAALQGARVPYVVLGGTALAETVYPAPSLRLCHDVDLLVPRAAWHRATRALAAPGFKPVAWWARARWEDGLVLVHASGLPVVLHQRLLAEPFDRPPIEETEVRAVAGVDSPVLAAEAAFLRGSCHAASTLTCLGTQWIADAWHLLRRSPAFDWDRLLAQAGGEVRAVTLGGVLRCLVRDLDVPVPDEVLRRLERPSGSESPLRVRGLPLRFRVARRIVTLPAALRRRVAR
jgi:Uncharacterised nucleotidyltransferase